MSLRHFEITKMKWHIHLNRKLEGKLTKRLRGKDGACFHSLLKVLIHILGNYLAINHKVSKILNENLLLNFSFLNHNPFFRIPAIFTLYRQYSSVKEFKHSLEIIECLL